MKTRTDFRTSSAMLLVLATTLAAWSCDSPTAPSTEITAETSSLRLTGAQVLFNGEIVNGQTMHTGQMQPGSVLFRATLLGAGGHPALGNTVHVEYRFPGGGMGPMGGQHGLLGLFDDGTHGDPVAGDGIYCFEDVQHRYGFHMQGAPYGQYHYEFFGLDHLQHRSNHMSVFVTVVQD